ncbi:MAG: histidine kinase [Kiritimatiellia bacterium]|nr:histidine kinase [Kiritimatiellia bacterium]
MDSENWQANFLFPQIRGFRIAVATPTDIRIIARPPWWTPGRLFVLVSALIVILVFILIWNASLRLLAERRGRALFRSQIAEVESELRVNERTRLAVELHDSISQNLAAISYEIAAENLPTADKMLRSCRTELRRCIWDLRNDALDEPDFNNAIRQTLAPVIGNASLGVDFNIVRARLNDTTAHAILSILRELAYNAVHHGRARNVHIVGEQTQMEVHFSLRDDGCGFDVQNCPGPSEGHFGLSGIRDRIGQLGGLIEIKSTTGAGTFVFVTIKTSNQEVKSHETYHRSPC